MNEASAAGVLAAARSFILDDTQSSADLEELARRFFDSNHFNPGGVQILSFDFVPDKTNGRYTLNVTAQVQTSLLAVTGRKFLPINISSSAVVTPAGPVEAVMVLDNTGSMSGQKLIDLKAAATSLTNTLLGSTTGRNSIGIVPFNRYVNVGPANLNEPWVSTTLLPDPAVDPSFSWNGCVGSRSDPNNVEDSGFTSDPAIALPDVSCPGPIVPLTKNKTTIINAINAMTASAGTFIGPGLAWGQRVISDRTPFTEGLSESAIAAQAGVKAIILLTDGANTKSPSFPYHDLEVESEANLITEHTCDEIKADSIRIYTIAFDVTEPSIISLLQDCASNDGGFYSASDTATLNTVFNRIAVNLTDLALTD